MTLLGGSASTYYVYGGDVSAYAGQAGELRFFGGGYLDNIQFSNLQIPEPSVLGLYALRRTAARLAWTEAVRMRLQAPVWCVGSLFLLLSATGAAGQGMFQNLNF